jgi:hypothetical protein
MLAEIAQRTRDPVVLAVDSPGLPFRGLVGVQKGGDVVLEDFVQLYGVPNYVRVDPEGAYGQTLFPRRPPFEADAHYAYSEQYELYVASDTTDVEIAASIWHELAHVRFGRGHSALIRAVEDEARRNARN